MPKSTTLEALGSWAVRFQDIQLESDRIIIWVESARPTGQCPYCGRESARVHSHYQRTLTDLPWYGRKVEIHWQSRRFYCDAADCPQKIFTERLPEVASAHARKSGRLLETLRVIALSCGGEGGSRLSQRLDMGTSGDTMLRLIRRQPSPCAATPRVLGVDDWAFRHGQNYGTILCDLESHHVIDLLPERSAESFQAWLGSRSGVEIITRDRGGYFINGATAGAPNATQVTDRWHLLSNLRETLVRIASRLSKQLLAAARSFQVAQTQEVGKQEAAASAAEAASPSASASVKSSSSPADADSPEMQKTPENKPKIEDEHHDTDDDHNHDLPPSRRRLRYEQVMELYSQGVSQRDIAQRLGIDRGTVGKYVHADGFPEHLGRRGRTRRLDRGNIANRRGHGTAAFCQRTEIGLRGDSSRFDIALEQWPDRRARQPAETDQT